MFFRTKDKKSDENIGLTEEAVLDVLRTVEDPDLHKDIVSLGFVKNLSIENGNVRFQVELTTPACPVKDQLQAESIAKVRALRGVKDVHVEMTSNVRATAPKGNRISLPSIKNVIAVASGKGGVGKSTVAVNLAVALSKTGAHVGILDADIYGPSIPTMLGTHEKPESKDNKLVPLYKAGVKMMSMGFLVPPDQAVIWRGPMVHGALTQFMTQVDWGDLDYLIIDMPPGTGDAQLTISQTAPLSGALIVTTPQEVSLADARRGLAMFKNVNVPVLGIVENMSGYICTHCDKTTHIFRQGGGARIAEENHVPLLAAIPLDPRVADSGDLGNPVVHAYPDSEAARLYRKLAGEVAAQLSILHAGGDLNASQLSLEWK